MRKISIGMYSTFSGSSYKADQLNPIIKRLDSIDLLNNFYGLPCKEDKNDIVSSISCRGRLSKVIMIVNGILRRVGKFLPFIDSHRIYYLGEKLFAIIYSRKIVNDNSTVLYLKPRPLSLIKRAKKCGKYVVIEAGECHPRYSQRLCKNELEKFNLKMSNIFTREKPVSDFTDSLAYADKIIVLSSFSKDTFVKEGVDESKIIVSNLGMRHISCRKKFIPDIKKPIVFICVSNASIIKNTHRLLKAWKCANLLDSKLFIVGNIMSDIKDYISKESDFNNVIFTGPLTHNQITEFYMKYNPVGILVSLAEGYGRSVVEYMYNGIPVIVSKSATCDIVSNKNGIIIDYDNVNAISEALKSIACDYELYVKMCDEVFKTELRDKNDFIKDTINILMGGLND